MVGLEKHIEKLLLSYDCVIIPGLGGFVAQYEPAYRVADEQTFYPPYRTIGFSTRLKFNDGLLVQSLMQTFDTNYPEAERILQQEVDSIRKSLHDEGQYDFASLGILEQKADDILQFEPKDNGGVATPGLYGLSSFIQRPYVASKPAEETVSPSHDTESAVAEKGHSAHYTIKLNRAVTNYIITTAAAIVFYFLFSIPVANTMQQSDHHLSAANGLMFGIPSSLLVSESPAPSTRPRAEALPVAKKSAVAEAPVAAKAPAKVAPVPSVQPSVENATVETSYYTIVLASAIKKTNAAWFVSELRKEGFADVSVFVKRKMTRVVYSRFSDEAAARRALSKLRQHEQFQEAWVLHVH